MKKVSVLLVLLALLLGVVFSTALADGTETLGPPSVTVASGSGFVAAGVGLEFAQPGTINVNVPGTVKQALLYWSGEFYANGGATDVITVNGSNVEGVRIGGPAYFYDFTNGQVFVAAYRADITGLVASGPNSLAVSGLDFDLTSDGAGVLVIYDDGSSTSEIDIRDGLDLAFFGFDEPRQNTVPQTFNFTPAAVDRTAELVIFAGNVEAGRPNHIEITVAGVTTTIVNPLSSADGYEWDTAKLQAFIPAGASSLTVQVFSTPSGDPLGASLSWIGAGLSVPVPPPPGGEGCTPGYWRNHYEDWPPTGYSPGDIFDTVFGTSYFDSTYTLGDAIWAGGGGVKKIARHGTAGLLSAAHPDVNYPYTVAEVIAFVQSGDVGALVDANELGCVIP